MITEELKMVDRFTSYESSLRKATSKQELDKLLRLASKDTLITMNFYAELTLTYNEQFNHIYNQLENKVS